MRRVLFSGASLPPASALGIAGGSAGIYEIKVVGTKLYCVGSFTSVIDAGGTHTGYTNVARLDLPTLLWDNWKPVVDDGYVVGLLVDASAGVCYIGGTFTACASGTTRNHCASFDTTTAALSSWNPDVNGSSNCVNTFTDDGTYIYVGGYFAQVNIAAGSVNRFLVARFHRTTGAVDVTWDAGITTGNFVRQINLDASSVYIVGDFTFVQAAARTQAVKVANSGNLAALDTWDAMSGRSSSVDPMAESLMDSSTTLLLVGVFTSLNSGNARVNGGRVLKTTGMISGSWNPAANGQIDRVRQSGADFFLGGRFTSINGQTRSYCAKMDSSFADLSAFNPTIDSFVYAMELYAGYVVLAGGFTVVNGVARNALAILNATNGAVL